MNESLQRLSNLYAKPERIILGLMSGTSLDGLDIALCKISGAGLDSRADVLEYETIPYDEDVVEDIKTIFSKRQIDLEKLTLLNAGIGALHAEMILRFLNVRNISPSSIDCIASHGQTVYHAPKRLHKLDNYPNATLQIGDGDHIAMKTGIITISDFRQKHIAAGAEGAPLALYGDYVLFSSDEEARILLNIGGISNFTFLPLRKASSPSVLSTDAGPGNTMIDALARKHFKISYDNNGDIARKGKVLQPLLNKLLKHPFFDESFPKTTGPELFNLAYFDACMEAVGINNALPEDLLCTATELTAAALARAIGSLYSDVSATIYISGGGARNNYLVERIGKLTGKPLKKLESLGISGDAKEAVLFAILANETVCGSAVKTAGGPAVMMGKISLPQ